MPAETCWGIEPRKIVFNFSNNFAIDWKLQEYWNKDPFYSKRRVFMFSCTWHILYKLHNCFQILATHSFIKDVRELSSLIFLVSWSPMIRWDNATILRGLRFSIPELSRIFCLPWVSFVSDFSSSFRDRRFLWTDSFNPFHAHDPFHAHYRLFQ